MREVFMIRRYYTRITATGGILICVSNVAHESLSFWMYLTISIPAIFMIGSGFITTFLKTRFVSQDGIILIGNTIYPPGSILRISTNGRAFFIIPKRNKWFRLVMVNPSKSDRKKMMSIMNQWAEANGIEFRRISKFGGRI